MKRYTLIWNNLESADDGEFVLVDDIVEWVKIIREASDPQAACDDLLSKLSTPSN